MRALSVFLRLLFALFCVSILIIGCKNLFIPPNGKSMVKTILDDHGRIIEKYGNEKTYDNDANFRSYFFYNSIGLLDLERYYGLDDENIECVIVDSLDYIETRFKYNDRRELIMKDRYFPEHDSLGNVLEHKLGYRYYVKTGVEQTFD